MQIEIIKPTQNPAWVALPSERASKQLAIGTIRYYFASETYLVHAHGKCIGGFKSLQKAKKALVDYFS